VAGSAGLSPDAASAAGTQIDGYLNFSNTGALYADGPMHVSGKFTASSNDMSH